MSTGSHNSGNQNSRILGPGWVSHTHVIQEYLEARSVKGLMETLRWHISTEARVANSKSQLRRDWELCDSHALSLSYAFPLEGPSSAAFWLGPSALSPEYRLPPVARGTGGAPVGSPLQSSRSWAQLFTVPVNVFQNGYMSHREIGTC